MNEHIDAAAKRILEARRGGPAIPADFIAAHPLSISEALGVREQVQAALGPVGGWKVAPSSTPEKPNFAPIATQFVYNNPARVVRSNFRKTGIECEIAYKIKADLVNPPYTREQVADAIAGIVMLIEICDSRMADNKAAPLGWQMADLHGNGAIVVSPLIQNWRQINTREQPVTLTFNGEIIAQAAGNAQPDLVAIVQLLAHQAGKHCGGVRAGQIVTTGSMTGNIPAPPNAEVRARYSKLGELEVVFEG